MRAIDRTALTLALLCACEDNKLPVWKGEVAVPAREREAIAICGDGALTTEGAQRVTRPPYLQSTTTTNTMIAWGSSDGRGQVLVRDPAGDHVATVEAAYAGDASRDRERLAAQHRPGHELTADDIYLVAAKIDGLEPGHLYCYQIVVDDVALTEPAPFTTAAAPDATVHFVAVGDVGTGGAAQLGIAKRMLAEPFDFALVLGDLAYDSGSASQLDSKFFAIYRDFMRYVPVYPSIGNHERRTRLGRPYFEAFVLPEPERYYSFDWGPIHFVAIDTTLPNTTQLEWLEQDLSSTKQRWVIAYGHHPSYTNSLRGPQKGVRRAFAKIFTEHHVDLVLTGHEHQYERFRIAGVNYIVSGGGGGQLTKFVGTKEALKQATVHHFLAFEVSPDELKMRAIDIAGNEIETLRLTKQGEATKVKVNGETDDRANPVAPETKTVPDETLHDEPDDDTQRKKAE